MFVFTRLFQTAKLNVRLCNICYTVHQKHVLKSFLKKTGTTVKKQTCLRLFDGSSKIKKANCWVSNSMPRNDLSNTSC
jgi:hypothetical protein